MLLELRIGNLALAEDVVLRPGTGLTVLTGETGAGKSLIAGALEMLTGGRVDRQIIRRGEDLAADFLLRQGYSIRETNARSRLGEIDIIAETQGDDGEPQLVFIEVKTRRGTAFGSPQEAVDARKQRRLARLAEAWLQQHPTFSRWVCRFDVIGITINSRGEASIEHIPAAF